MSRANVTRNDDESRYEIAVDGELAGFSQFRRHQDVISFIHTEIEEQFEGQGLASVLVRHALDEVRSEGLRVRPYCPYIRAWIQSHPDYQDLVDPAWTASHAS